LTDREKILQKITDANTELARATEYAVIVEKKGTCGEEGMLEDRLLETREGINQALNELQG
jgi:hypothetical protein